MRKRFISEGLVTSALIYASGSSSNCTEYKLDGNCFRIGCGNSSLWWFLLSNVVGSRSDVVICNTCSSKCIRHHAQLLTFFIGS